MGKSYKKIAAVGITNQILVYLSKQRTPVSAAQIAHDTGIPYGTVMCHLATHEDFGIVRSVGEQFELGMEIAKFWARIKSREEARRNEAEHNLSEINVDFF